MNKRCIVNVATGDFYCKMQERLVESFRSSVDHISTVSSRMTITKNFDERTIGIDLIVWHDCLPPGSRPHSESPYGFKVHAIKAAYDKGYTSVLWLDSPAYAVKEDISPIFEKIEKEGYYAMSHIDPLRNHVGSVALSWFEMERDDLVGLNLPSGSCYGFDLKSKIGKTIFEELRSNENSGEFSDESLYDNGQLVWKHRHDEAILALILIREKLPIFTFDPLFQSDSPECVIKSGGL